MTAQCCNATFSWEDSDDFSPLCVMFSSKGSSSTFVDQGLVVRDLPSDLCCDCICGHERHGSRDIHCWDDSDDLGFHTDNLCMDTKTTAGPIKVVERVKYVPPQLEHASCLPFVKTRDPNWRKRSHRQWIGSKRQAHEWRKFREHQRACAAERTRQAKKDNVKGQHVSVCDSDVRSAVLQHQVMIERVTKHNANHPTAHVSGDGNCLWRSLWIVTGTHPNRRNFKKDMLKKDQGLKQYRPCGVHGNAECVIAVAKHTQRRIVVDVGTADIVFTPGTVSSQDCLITIIQGHAQPTELKTARGARQAWTTEQPVASQHAPLKSQEKVFDVHSCVADSVNAGARKVVSPERITNTTRRKRTRVSLDVSDRPTEHLFVDDHLTDGQVALHVALHKGINPKAMLVKVHDGQRRVKGTVTKLIAPTKPALESLVAIAPITLAGRSHMQLATAEVFMGHRATRKRGILAATHRVARICLARAVHMLGVLLPEFNFIRLVLSNIRALRSMLTLLRRTWL
eukprot:1844715-Amphidinium_carterae.1